MTDFGLRQALLDVASVVAVLKWIPILRESLLLRTRDILATLEPFPSHSVSDANLRLEEGIAPLEPPDLVEHLSRRPALIERLKVHLRQATWLALIGQIGIGKTHAVALLIKASGGCDAWARLRDTSEEVAIRRLNAACLRLVRKTTDEPRYASQRDETALSPRGLIVLDDIPRFGPNAVFWERLVSLAKEFARTGTRLVTTSNSYLPDRVQELLPGRIWSAVDCPLFQEEELKEVFKALGAPDALLSEDFVSFLRELTQGHPLLVSAAGRYLRQHAWRRDSDVLRHLLAGHHVIEVGQDTLEKLVESTDDVEGRELLYRLKLVRGSFSSSQVSAVAGVPRAIERPQERLAPLLGTWVQRDGFDEYLLSPLLSTVRSLELLPETKRGCHLALAEEIRHRESVDPADFCNMVTHYAAAIEYGKALTMLAYGLHHLIGPIVYSRRDISDGGLADLWALAPLPASVELGHRIHIRAMQIAVRLSKGKDVKGLIGDLEGMISKCGQDSWVHIVVAANLVVLSLPVSFRGILTRSRQTAHSAALSPSRASTR